MQRFLLMDIGDFGYIIFLVIVGIANLLRARNKQQQSKREEAKRRSAPGREGRSIPVPQQSEEEAEDGRYHRDSSQTGTSSTATGEGRYRRESSRDSRPAQETAEKEVFDWREMMTEMLEGEARSDQSPAPRPAPVKAAPVPTIPMGSVARGMREGESVAEYAARTRRESSAKFSANLLAESDGIKQATGSLDFDPDFRDAVIYDAIFRPPYI